jgi:hypothetical protein
MYPQQIFVYSHDYVEAPSRTRSIPVREFPQSRNDYGLISSKNLKFVCNFPRFLVVGLNVL